MPGAYQPRGMVVFQGYSAEGVCVGWAIMQERIRLARGPQRGCLCGPSFCVQTSSQPATDAPTTLQNNQIRAGWIEKVSETGRIWPSGGHASRVRLAAPSTGHVLPPFVFITTRRDTKFTSVGFRVELWMYSFLQAVQKIDFFLDFDGFVLDLGAQRQKPRFLKCFIARYVL